MTAFDALEKNIRPSYYLSLNYLPGMGRQFSWELIGQWVVISYLMSYRVNAKCIYIAHLNHQSGPKCFTGNA